MDIKILDFNDALGRRAELWGNLSDAPIKIAAGVAQAFVEADTVYISFYEPTGLTGSGGELKRLSCRIAVPLTNLPALSEQFQMLFKAFPANATSPEESAALEPVEPTPEKSEVLERIF